jgi:endonuclease/exonuclease/phosphatase family metal-dependent hydrolase
MGDTAYFDIKVMSLTDSLIIKLRLIGTPAGSSLAYGIGGQGLTEVWYTDTSFHQSNAVMGNRDVIVKYKPSNTDATQSQDILFAIHDSPVYEIDPADATNPHVLNVMSFNAQMLPLGIAGLDQASLRASIIPTYMSPYQDVVVFQELMDESARVNNLIPGMVAQGFTYYTQILNYDPQYITNGGVIFFSRWPIERTQDWEYTACGPNSEDCIAIKGVQYIKINKLGIKYHLFGTHMDAGGLQEDIDAKQVQMGEIRRFIEAQNIPQYEAVILGGDFNTSPFSAQNLYANMLDTLNPFLPDYSGYYTSTEFGYPGKVIDHLWTFKDYLVPLESTNYITTFRSIDDRMWKQSWLGDHRPILGRFVFPDITLAREPSAICPSDSLYLSVTTSLPTGYVWQKDGQLLSNSTNEVLYYPATATDGGTYNCRINYTATTGNPADSLNSYLHIYGPDTVNVDLNIAFGNIAVDSVLCLLGLEDVNKLQANLYPNPASNVLTVELVNANGPTNVSICNMQGKVMFTEVLNLQTATIKVEQLPAGVYLLQLSSKQSTSTSRFVIAR